MTSLFACTVTSGRGRTLGVDVVEKDRKHPSGITSCRRLVYLDLGAGHPAAALTPHELDELIRILEYARSALPS